MQGQEKLPEKGLGTLGAIGAGLERYLGPRQRKQTRTDIFEVFAKEARVTAQVSRDLLCCPAMRWNGWDQLAPDRPVRSIRAAG